MVQIPLPQLWNLSENLASGTPQPKPATLCLALAAVAVALLSSFPVQGGPVEFGNRELRAALAARGLPASYEVRTEIVPGPAEAYRIQPGKVSASDERGLMYGLLEAAEQIRAAGRLSPARGEPQTPIRGIRYFLHNHDLEEDWFYSHDYWDQYLSMLARNRFNRFNLVYAHQTAYLAPPYPFWINVPEFPGVRVPGLTSAARERNFEILRYIAQTAADHGIDFTLGIWEHNIQAKGMTPSVEGLTRENIGPYSYAALKKVLNACPAIRSVQMRTNAESGIANEDQVEFYGKWVYRAIKEANHPVVLDLRGWLMAGGMADAVKDSDLNYRLSSKYWAEFMGRPYQPGEMRGGYSYGNFLEKPAGGGRPYDFYFELWGLGSHRLLLWGDPQYVRRAVPTLRLSGAAGFEIDPPLAQKGFGNRPGKWGIFTAAEKERTFWKYEFERYWLFYMLWGRLSYDTATSDAVWMSEMTRRFGAAAEDVMNVYASASPVVGEIVTCHLIDANMYWWPEINPGGPVDKYRTVRPNDTRYTATFSEAVRNRLERRPSAKQTPLDVAAAFDRMAAGSDAALRRARGKIPAGNREWLSSELDFRVLTALARYYAAKQRGAYNLAWFDETGDRSALESSERDLSAALAVWQDLAAMTKGVYPAEMAYGPADQGHWADKLPSVRRDLDLVRERLAKAKDANPPLRPIPPTLPRPRIVHRPPTEAEPQQPLQLTLQISPPNRVSLVRLHYRPLNQSAKFKTLEATPQNLTFKIPAKDISPKWDLLYYFEILNDQQTGWFEPDPATATPYYVVTVGPKGHGPGPAR